MDSRERVRVAYSADSEGYDRHRLGDSRGRLLSDHDIELFRTMLPAAARDGQVLEVGAGTGRFTIPLLDEGCSVIATDVNDGMLQRLRVKADSEGYAGRCRVQVEDAFRLSFPSEMFRTVVSMHFIPRLLSEEDQLSALSEMARVTASGGRLLFNFRNKLSPYSLFYKSHTLSARRMKEMLYDLGFSVEVSRGKHVITRKLLDRIPSRFRPGVAMIDKQLWGKAPDRAWDVFVLAKKRIG